ncbi:nose resistant to fluoxetine protein 6-like [Vanessa cardui]|uniref:nose resistant to fluoxetine protein 6-like n=1 Tax=Vanessa cardui TaxID=171605 RepID=UPI001F1402A9|nr:nose resistant to fluoxetine protein 6-like [Vanessa cardui]
MAYNCNAVIYKLNDSEYARMPKVFHLDDYDYCLINPDGIYCTADIDIVSDDPSNELLTMMRNYSDYDRKHFNYTQVHYGICLTQTCKHFMGDNKTEDQKFVLEECLNQSLWENYQLKCRISKPIICNYNESKRDDIEIDTGDILMAAFLVSLILINCLSSIYDIVFVKIMHNQGNRFLMCFSIPHNYSKLMSSYKNFDSREDRLKSFHGLRTITIICVILCHSFLPIAVAPENPRSFEMRYENIFHLFFINGTLLVQSFFVMSGCLLAYKVEVYAEKHEMKWTLIPKAIIGFWIKLMPSYIVVLGLTATWLRHLGSGPLWDIAVNKEVQDCRTNGWANLLYVNNYIDSTLCMGQTWYLGSIMQMYVIGSMVCILARSNRSKITLLTLLFIVGIITPAAHTYFEDLDAIYIMTPQNVRVFEINVTFNKVYRRGHTNLVNFVLGLASGILIYRLQVNQVDMAKYKKHRFLFLLTIPAVFGLLFAGSVFYKDDYEPSVITRAMYAGLVKPFFGVNCVLFIFGCVFKIDNVYRIIFEWDGWKIPSKLSYCVFLLHFMIIRIMTGICRTLTPINKIYMIDKSLNSIILSYLAAILLFILADAPLTEFLKLCLEFTIFNTKNKSMKQEQNNGVYINKSADTLVDEEEIKGRTDSPL